MSREGSEPRVSSSSADAGRAEGASGPGGDRGNFRSDSRGPSDRSVHLPKSHIADVVSATAMYCYLVVAMQTYLQ
jgi:hypothetical protein